MKMVNEPDINYNQQLQIFLTAIPEDSPHDQGFQIVRGPDYRISVISTIPRVITVNYTKPIKFIKILNYL